MKCPSCGAEVKGKFCEYCGSEMPQEKPIVNITNNYYGSTTPQDNTEIENNLGKCPKCGNSKITFKRERVGTATQSRSRKNYIGSGRQSQSVSQSAYRTVGVCQNCGYTWNPNATTKSSGKKTWLWVLGWICIFPLPLTILLLRKKEMKPVVKYGIIAVAWVLFLVIGMAGNSETDVPQTDTPPSYNETVQSNQSETSNSNIEKEETEQNKIVDDEVVNRFLSECKFDYGEIDKGNIRTKFFVHVNGCRTELLNSNTGELVIKINGYHIDNINEPEVIEAFKVVAQTINGNEYDTEIEDVITGLLAHDTAIYEGTVGNINYKFYPFVELSKGVVESRIEIRTTIYNLE